MTTNEQILGALSKYKVGVLVRLLTDDIGGIQRRTLNKRLCRMSQKNLVCKWPHTGGVTRWCLPENLSALKDDHERIKREKLEAGYERWANCSEAKRIARREKERAKREISDDDPFYLPVTKTVVNASNAPHIRLTGPASVWDLAA